MALLLDPRITIELGCGVAHRDVLDRKRHRCGRMDLELSERYQLLVLEDLRNLLIALPMLPGRLAMDTVSDASAFMILKAPHF